MMKFQSWQIAEKTWFLTLETARRVDSGACLQRRLSSRRMANPGDCSLRTASRDRKGASYSTRLLPRPNAVQRFHRTQIHASIHNRWRRIYVLAEIVNGNNLPLRGRL